MANNTVKARIQLKNDTEAHWNLAENFIPRQGEVIIYSADDTHPFSRLKIGDGETLVASLPFVESGSVNGFSLLENFQNFPSIGDAQTMYYDVSKNIVYGWDNSEGYYEKYGVVNETIKTIETWDCGVMTRLEVDGNILIVNNGTEPNLVLKNTNVVTGYSSLI